VKLLSLEPYSPAWSSTQSILVKRQPCSWNWFTNRLPGCEPSTYCWNKLAYTWAALKDGLVVMVFPWVMGICPRFAVDFLWLCRCVAWALYGKLTVSEVWVAEEWTSVNSYAERLQHMKTFAFYVTCHSTQSFKGTDHAITSPYLLDPNSFSIWTSPLFFCLITPL